MVNTIGKTIRQLKAFLKDRMAKKIIPLIDLGAFKGMEEDVDGVFLDWNELSKVYHMELALLLDIIPVHLQQFNYQPYKGPRPLFAMIAAPKSCLCNDTPICYLCIVKKNEHHESAETIIFRQGVGGSHKGFKSRSGSIIPPAHQR